MTAESVLKEQTPQPAEEREDLSTRISDWLNPIVVKELRQAVQSHFVVAALLILLAIQIVAVGIYLLTASNLESNFDAGRTRTACAVLREFAKQGHQLLVFTCHEHVWQMFKEIKVDCRRIPNRRGPFFRPETWTKLSSQRSLSCCGVRRCVPFCTHPNCRRPTSPRLIM